MSNPLPENWVQAPLKELILPTETINPISERQGNIRYIDIESVDNKRQVIANPKSIPSSEAPSRARRKVHLGDVIFSLVRPYLKNLAIIPQELDGEVASTAFFVSRLGTGVKSEWLYRHLQRDGVINALPTVGNSPPATRDIDFEEHCVPIAPTKEQQRILYVLEPALAKIDEAEEALERVRRNLDRYRASVLKAACEGRLVPTEAELARQENRDYEPASELLKRILIARREAWEKAQLEAYAKKDKTPPKDWKSRYPEPQAPDTSDLPELPEGWCWVSATQICAQVVDCHNKTAPYSGQGIPLIRTTNIRGGKIDLQQTKFVTETTYNHWSRRCPPEPGDILFTREAPMGEAGIIPDGARLCMGQRMMLLRASEGILNHYLLIALGSPDMMNHIFQNSIGTGVKHLRVRDVEGLPIPLPPFAEQQEIVSEVERLISVHGELERFVAVNRQRCHTLRQSLLKHAFSGKLVPQDSADEPASMLLERIRAQGLELKGGTTPRKRVVRKTKKTS